MSNRSRTVGRRASRGQKQPGILEILTRGKRESAIMDDSQTVIDLCDDDPVSKVKYKKYEVIYSDTCCSFCLYQSMYISVSSLNLQYKFVDSQSLLPDTNSPPDTEFTSAPMWSSVSHPQGKDSPSTGNTSSTPKRYQTSGGTQGSTKRKRTPKSKKSKLYLLLS